MTQTTACSDLPSDTVLNECVVDHQSSNTNHVSQPCTTATFVTPPPTSSAVPRSSALQSSHSPSAVASHPAISRAIARECEGCRRMHGGTYGSGRFCGATCAKKVGARHKWAARASTTPASRRLSASLRASATIAISSNTSAAVASPTPHIVVSAPCESCHKLHDKSYGSGRFCSVHCARRVAATRKWEKSRSEKSKRLDAIRPAMISSPISHHQSPILNASPSSPHTHLDHHQHHSNSSNSLHPTPPPSHQTAIHASVPASSSVLAGKRRQLTRQIDRVHIALQHAAVSSPPVVQRFDVPATTSVTPNVATNDISMVPPGNTVSSAQYLPQTVPPSSFPPTTHGHAPTPIPQPMYPSVHPLLAQRTRAFPFPAPTLHPGVTFNPPQTPSPAPNPAPVTHIAYGYPYAPVPAYTAMHASPHSLSEPMFAAYSPISTHSSAPASLSPNSPAESVASANPVPNVAAPSVMAPISTLHQLQQHQHQLQLHQLQQYQYAQFACAAQRAAAIPATYSVPIAHSVAYDTEMVDPIAQVSNSSSSTPPSTGPGPNATAKTSAMHDVGTNDAVASSVSAKGLNAALGTSTTSSQPLPAYSATHSTCRSDVAANDRPAIENSETAARALLCLRSTNS